MKYIQDIENQEHLKEFVLQDLKEKYGLKMPKGKKNKTRDESLELGRNIFGNHLCLLPCMYIDGCGPVPKFLVDASQLLEKHADTEGLFRKSGSVARQKELKARIENGEDLNDANPLDLASVLKQFFRELPDPLLTSRYHDNFIRLYSLEPDTRRLRALLLLCLVLPWHHLCVLRYMMIFLKNIANRSESNKMDIQNLAVCLAPNLLYTSAKSDRLNMSESKLLQIQTYIVHQLITNADTIGMVCDTLVERTTLMGSLFPSEEEVDGGGIAHDDSKSSKKKKKRSASFQAYASLRKKYHYGLMSNLSNSFSKWRKDTKHHHNASNVSERSGYSFTSVADKSSVLIPDHPDSLAYLETLADMTPKMIRKRKAEDEMVPFSASKKQAILQSMPHMSTLRGTPFTPNVKQGKRTGEYVDTPNIKFCDNSDTVFGGTPRLRMDKYLSTPVSSLKEKHGHRKSPSYGAAVAGKSGCFSPKTPRNSVRRTMRGFLKRLSGGKDQQVFNPGDVEEKLAGGSDYVSLVEQPNKRRSFFGKHRKTPSSPARLITPIIGRDERKDSVPKIMLEGQGTSSNSESFLKNPSDVDPPNLSSVVRHNCSAENPNSSALRRGKPNTVKTGLPSPNHRRSIDRSSVCSHTENVEIDTNAKHRFLSPDKFGPECVASTVDTSPILKNDEAAFTSEVEITNLDDTSSTQLSRQISQASVMSISIAEQTQLESEHDRAFIQESMLGADDNAEENGDNESEKCEEKQTLQMTKRESFRFCNRIAEQKRLNEYTIKKQLIDDLNCDEEEDMEGVEMDSVFVNNWPSKKIGVNDQAITVISDACEKSKKQVGHIDSSPLHNEVGKKNSPSKTHSAASLDSLQNQNNQPQRNSVESLDSAISDCQSAGGMSKHASLQSIKSFDSGLSVNDPSNPKVSSSISLAEKPLKGAKENKESESFITSQMPSTKYSSANSSVILRRESMNQRAKDSSLRATQDVHTLLTKVGASEEGDINDLKLKRQEFKLSSSSTSEEDEISIKQAKKEIAQRRASPLRFSNSVSRHRGGVSPIRIPTIFVKADREASRYRQLAALRMSPGRKQPLLPVSTNLVNASSVMEVRSRLDLSHAYTDSDSPEENTDNTHQTHAGHTPNKLLTDNSLHSTEIDAPVTGLPPINPHHRSHAITPQKKSTGTPIIKSHLSTPQLISSLSVTPKIKQSLLSTVRGIPTGMTSPSSLGSRPIKRLQGSKSPKKGVLDQQIENSSMSASVMTNDWNI